MPSRRRPLVTALLLATLLLVGGGAAWRLATTSPEDEHEAATATAPGASKPTPGRRSRGAAASTSSPDGSTSAATTATPVEEVDWTVELRRLLDGDATVTPESIVDAAGKGRPPGEGLVEILRRGREDLERADGDASRRRAQDIVDWAIDRVLTPYRKDRALFAPIYRRTRFGDGDLGRQGGSLVRQLRFEEAAAKMDAVRGELATWCYDALAIRAAGSFRNDAMWWKWYGTHCTNQKWAAPPMAGTTAADTTPPAALFGTYVRPHLSELNYYVAMGLGKVFLDLGELDAAAECLARSRQALAAPELAAALAVVGPFLDECDVEIAAFRELRSLTALRLPATAFEDAGVTRWFATRRPTEVAHAIGTDGAVEIGEWDEAMSKSFLEGGLPWAPEQWEVERARRDAAKRETRDGIAGFVVRSPKWEVFSDVSAEFAAHASLVLEAGFGQTQAGLGVTANPQRRLGARIYAHRATYREITRDFSGGEWMPKLNSVLTFVDDPLRDDFEQFRYTTLVHESTHAALHWSVGAVPAWMNEGLACFVQRWNPTWSMAVNWGSTKDWVRRRRILEKARDEGRLPTLDQLLALTDGWDADDFGPITTARYAAAESFFVYLAGDAERWLNVRRWLGVCANRQDPTATITKEQRAEFAKGWAELIDFVCGRLESAK
jgi:hypothetical protein